MVKPEGQAHSSHSLKPFSRAALAVPTMSDDEPVAAPDSETEERILDAAHAVFLRRGTAGARTQEIADEAGVNKALLHYYFRSKERLAEAVFRRAARRLLPPVLTIISSRLTIEEKVRQIVAHQLDVLSEVPDLPGYVLSELHHHPERIEQLMSSLSGMAANQIAPLILTRLGAQIDEEVAAGRMRPIAPEQFMINLVSLCIYPFAARPMVTFLIGRGADGFRAFIEERKRTLPEFFLHALRP
jgi:TetR/AcrR family transcriptional regulator